MHGQPAQQERGNVVRFLRCPILAVVLVLVAGGIFQAMPGDGSDKDLIYSVNRTPEQPFETGRAVKVITSDDIWRKNARTLAEVLAEEPGIFVQQTDYSAGSPIIRGMIGPDILILVDGVKINNATYRLGPNQYLNTIDVNMVERIEIVRGVESVLTSYALGAVINIITKKGPPGGKTQPVGGQLFARYSSADVGLTGHAEVYGNNSKFRYHAGATFRDTGNAHAGGDIGLQKWTGYDMAGGNISFDYFISKDKTLSFDYLGTEHDKVPRTDRLVSGTNRLFTYDPLLMQLGKVAFQDLAKHGFVDSMLLTVSYAKKNEGRQEIKSSTPNVEQFYYDKDGTFGLDLEFSSFIGSSHRMLYGMDFFTDEISSSRKDLTLTTGVFAPKRGQYTDGATYQTLAFYVQDRFEPWRWLSLTPGARLNRYAIDGSEQTSAGTLDLHNSDQDITGSISAIVQPSENFHLIANVSRGFRAPNVDDISVYDDRGSTVEVPNPELKSGKILTYEGGAKFHGYNLDTSAFFFYNSLTDMYQRAPGLFNGLSYLDKNGNGVKDTGEPTIYQRASIGEAMIKGVEFDASYKVHSEVTLFGNYTWTMGNDLTADVPLTRMPPTYGALGARWSGQSKLKPWAELVYHFATAQRRLSPSDITDTRIGANGTAGFHIINFRAGLSLLNKFRMTAALENLTDRAYKYHGSGVYRPGFQVVLGAEVSF
jgi:hemoglobin/transferrin/lactoferrin receptor protein